MEATGVEILGVATVILLFVLGLLYHRKASGPIGRGVRRLVLGATGTALVGLGALFVFGPEWDIGKGVDYRRSGSEYVSMAIMVVDVATRLGPMPTGIVLCVLGSLLVRKACIGRFLRARGRSEDAV